MQRGRRDSHRQEPAVDINQGVPLTADGGLDGTVVSYTSNANTAGACGLRIQDGGRGRGLAGDALAISHSDGMRQALEGAAPD